MAAARFSRGRLAVSGHRRIRSLAELARGRPLGSGLPARHQLAHRPRPDAVSRFSAGACAADLSHPGRADAFSRTALSAGSGVCGGCGRARYRCWRGASCCACCGRPRYSARQTGLAALLLAAPLAVLGIYSDLSPSHLRLRLRAGDPAGHPAAGPSRDSNRFWLARRRGAVCRGRDRSAAVLQAEHGHAVSCRGRWRACSSCSLRDGCDAGSLRAIGPIAACRSCSQESSLALLIALALIFATAGLGNYLHWTVQFAAQRRLPGLGSMLAVYSAARVRMDASHARCRPHSLPHAGLIARMWARAAAFCLIAAPFAGSLIFLLHRR